MNPDQGFTIIQVRVMAYEYLRQLKTYRGTAYSTKTLTSFNRVLF